MIFPQLSCTAADETGYVKMTGLRQAIYALLHKDEIMSTRYEGAVSDETWSAQDEYSLENTAVVIKQRDRDFTILNLTDLHFADYDERAFMAFDTIATVKKLVRRTKPDLITVTGDILCSESMVYAVKRFTDMMDSFGIPWAPVFGNHEVDGNCDMNYLAEIMMKSSRCLMKKGDPAMGVGNYIVNIAEENEDGSLNVIDSLIMLDSHKTQVNARQIQWYEWAVNGINSVCGKEVESAAFFHIPLAQYQYAYDAAWDGENKAWREGYGAAGKLNEKICCERDENGVPVDGGFFDAAKRAGTKNIFCGHEHMNNFSIVYDGVRLTYTMKVGKASGFQMGFNGGTVIKINSDGLAAITHKTVILGVMSDLLTVDAQ